MAQVVKNPPTNPGDIRDVGLIPGVDQDVGRSPGVSHIQRSMAGYSP